MPTLLRQRMCASCLGDRCLEAKMLQLQCKYYNDQGESGSNASGRQSKSGNSGRDSKNWPLIHLDDPMDGCPAGNSRHKAVPNTRTLQIEDRMILIWLSIQCPE